MSEHYLAIEQLQLVNPDEPESVAFINAIDGEFESSVLKTRLNEQMDVDIEELGEQSPTMYVKFDTVQKLYNWSLKIEEHSQVGEVVINQPTLLKHNLNTNTIRGAISTSILERYRGWILQIVDGNNVKKPAPPSNLNPEANSPTENKTVPFPNIDIATPGMTDSTYPGLD